MTNHKVGKGKVTKTCCPTVGISTHLAGLLSLGDCLVPALGVFFGVVDLADFFEFMMKRARSLKLLVQILCKGVVKSEVCTGN